MPIGLMNQRVYLEYPTITRDDYGGRLTTWAKKSSAWASVKYTPAGQEMDGDRVLTKAVIVVKIHHRTDVAENWRIKWGEDYYQIRGIENEFNRNKFLIITADLSEAF